MGYNKKLKTSCELFIINISVILFHNLKAASLNDVKPFIFNFVSMTQRMKFSKRYKEDKKNRKLVETFRIRFRINSLVPGSFKFPLPNHTINSF
jgi:hypothetical protein